MAVGLCAALCSASCGGAAGTPEDGVATDVASAPVSAAPSTIGGAATTAAVSTSTTTATPSPTTIPPAATTTSIPPPPPSTTDRPTTTRDTTPAPAPPTTAASAPVEYGDAAGPLPVGALLDSSLTLDFMGDGTTDDLIEVWDVDGWSRLRLTTSANVVSEVVNPAIDGRYRPLGVASVLPGDSDELFSVVAVASAGTEIGVFGIDSADCLFSYTYTSTSDDFTMLIRPESRFRSGALCFDGGIDLFSAEQRADGAWDASSSAWGIASPWTLQYLGGTDDYAEGLGESELRPFVFDCFGLSL